MLKAITHFEQVPLGLVMKIMERDKQKEYEESREKNKQNPEARLPAVMTTKVGA